MAKLNQQKLELFTYIWVEGLNGKNLWRWVGLVRGRRMDWNWRARLSYVLCYWPRLSQSFLNQPPGGGVYPYYVRGGGGNWKEQKLLIQKSYWRPFRYEKKQVDRSSFSFCSSKLTYISLQNSFSTKKYLLIFSLLLNFFKCAKITIVIDQTIL